MSIEIALNTPLAEALQAEIQPKLVEVGWSSDSNDLALTEYIVLMLANGKTQEEIAAEIANDLLNLGPDDAAAVEFAQWLFQQVAIQNAKVNGASLKMEDDGVGASQDDSTTMGDDQEMDLMSGVDSAPDVGLNAPTGPKAMRTGGPRGGRDKRMLGQVNRAMDRSSESILHRVGGNGNSRINMHNNRGTPNGPRMGAGRQPRGGANRAASIAHGMAAGMGGPGARAGPMNGAMGAMGNGQWGMPNPASQQQQVDLFAILQQQSQMMQQMQQQMMMQTQQGHGQNGRFNNHNRPDRGGHNKNFRKNNQYNQNGQTSENAKTGTDAEGNDVEMGESKREPQNPDETVCKFNLKCTNKDCKFAHQSPAAPPGITIDVHDTCSFGAACKNHKCVGRHPSPANKMAHQSEQDCKFFPNCTNPRCPFRHPSAPLCRNGADCAVAGCPFTHSKTMCKFRPCTNRYCTFKHEEGQRGAFPDRVWTADGAKTHVSERKFVDETAPEDNVMASDDVNDMKQEVKNEMDA